MSRILQAPRCAFLIIAVTAVALFSCLTVPPSSAGEVVPQLGLTKPTEGNHDAKLFGGLALRGNLAPFLKSEIGVSYRNEERLNGNLDVRQWPITASLWLAPVPVLYAGGGVGWYNTTLDYNDALGIDNETSQDFGVHLGGGLTVPVSPKVGVDLNGRYVFMGDIETEFGDLDHLDPDYWTTSLGLAIVF